MDPRGSLTSRLKAIEAGRRKRLAGTANNRPLTVMVLCYSEAWAGRAGRLIYLPWNVPCGAAMGDLRSRLAGANPESVEGIATAWAEQYGAEWQRLADCLAPLVISLLGDGHALADLGQGRVLGRLDHRLAELGDDRLGRVPLPFRRGASLQDEVAIVTSRRTEWKGRVNNLKCCK